MSEGHGNRKTATLLFQCHSKRKIELTTLKKKHQMTVEWKKRHGDAAYGTPM